MLNRKSTIYLLISVVLFTIIISSCLPESAGTPGSSSGSGGTPSSGTGITPSSPAKIGERTKTSGCVSVNGLPDSACTPGAILPDATKDQICVSGYSSKVRNVPDSVKNAVYAEYGIASHTPGQYEVDHLISLELGGSNDIANLWPEPAEPRPGFHEKDKVENYEHEQVCSGAVSLQQAQIDIATDWFKIYKLITK
jgi:hypothetical protein